MGRLRLGADPAATVDWPEHRAGALRRRKPLLHRPDGAVGNPQQPSRLWVPMKMQ
jgi:hypothetical protein